MPQFLIIDEGCLVHDNALYVLGACNDNNLATLGSDEWRNKFTCLWTYISLQRDFRPGTNVQHDPNYTEPNSYLSVPNICQVNFNATIICGQFSLWPHLNSSSELLRFFHAYCLVLLWLWCLLEWKLRKYFFEKKMSISKWNSWKPGFPKSSIFMIYSVSIWRSPRVPDDTWKIIKRRLNFDILGSIYVIV